MSRKKACTACRGRGQHFEANCNDCNGSGGEPTEENPYVQCHSCHGDGTVHVSECVSCDGTGVSGGM